MRAYDDTVLSRTTNTVLPMEAELYLHEFRRGLLALPESERASIVAEVREQIAAQATLGRDGLLKLLARLGKPEHLARQFTVSFELAASVNRSNPLRLLFVVLAAATMDLWALAGATLAVVVYLLGAAFGMIALLKPVIPQYTGAWVTDSGDLNMGIMLTHSGHEVLGYAIIPISAALAVVAILFANRLLRICGRRLLRRSRQRERLGA